MAGWLTCPVRGTTPRPKLPAATLSPQVKKRTSCGSTSRDLTMEGEGAWDNHMRFQLRWKGAPHRHSSSSTMDLRDRSLLFGLARPPASPKSMEMTTGQPRACAASPDSCRHKETRIRLPSDIVCTHCHVMNRASCFALLPTSLQPKLPLLSGDFFMHSMLLWDYLGY